jgi:alkylation response protein AidB-like acyl-CoA dehydrogenase
MDAELTPEQEELRATLRRFLAERAPLAHARAHWEAEPGFDRAVWRQLAELGVVGLLVPEKHGGAGAGMIEAGLVLEELGRVLYPGPYLSSAVGAVSAALALDAPELAAELGRGERIASLALLEPGTSPRDWRTPRCRAPGGRVRGDKIEVIDAALADLFLVSTEQGVFAVESRGPGVALEPLDGTDRSRRLARVRFEDAPGKRLGEVESLSESVDRVLLGLALDALGAAETAMDLAVAYAKQRRQFGRPIGSFQAVAHLCADMLAAVELGRAGAYYALWAADHTEPAERNRAALLARAYAADAYPRVGADAIQVHGGVGYAWETDPHLCYKRLLAAQHVWGGAAVWYEELASLICV